MKIVYSKCFKKQYQRLPLLIQEKCDERIIIFVQNEFSPILNNHALHGDRKYCRSVNVSSDYRIIYRKENDIVFVLEVGSHSQLCG